MVKAKLSYDSVCPGICPPSAFLSKTELGWAAWTTF